MRTAMNEYPRDCEMWLDAFKSKYDGEGKVFGREEWDQLLGNFSVSPTRCRGHYDRYRRTVYGLIALWLTEEVCLRCTGNRLCLRSHTRLP